MAYPEKTDTAWITWGRNWNSLVTTATAASFGLTEDQAAAAAATYNDFKNAYTAATDPATRSAPTIQAKDDGLRIYRDTMKSIVATVQANTGVSNKTRKELGLRVRDTKPTPAPIPTAAPEVSLLLTGMQTARAVASDPLDPTRRAKPAGIGKVVFRSFKTTTNEQPPADLTMWPIEQISGRTSVDFYWPDITSTTNVYITACWMNTRGQCGPISAVQGVQLSGSLLSVDTGEEGGEPEMKIAA